MHSREISLHDLNILHDGSDFVGPLRLLLRAIVPRFIMRYYALQEQTQRLNVAAETETGEGERDEGLVWFSLPLPDSLRLFQQNITNSTTLATNNAFNNKELPRTRRSFWMVRKYHLLQK